VFQRVQHRIVYGDLFEVDGFYAAIKTVHEVDPPVPDAVGDGDSDSDCDWLGVMRQGQRAQPVPVAPLADRPPPPPVAAQSDWLSDLLTFVMDEFNQDLADAGIGPLPGEGDHEAPEEEDSSESGDEVVDDASASEVAVRPPPLPPPPLLGHGRPYEELRSVILDDEFKHLGLDDILEICNCKQTEAWSVVTMDNALVGEVRIAFNGEALHAKCKLPGHEGCENYISTWPTWAKSRSWTAAWLIAGIGTDMSSHQHMRERTRARVRELRAETRDRAR